MTCPPTTKDFVRRERAYILGTLQIKLTCLDICLGALENTFRHDKAESAHLAKIRRWVMGCWEFTGAPKHEQVEIDGQLAWVPVGKGRRRLSAAVQRRADRETAVIDSIRRDVVGSCTTVPAWASWLVCLDALVDDVALSMVKGRPDCWFYLAWTWDTITRRFIAACEDGAAAERDGAEMYERIVEANQW